MRKELSKRDEESTENVITITYTSLCSEGSWVVQKSNIVKTSIFYIEHQGQFRAWGYQT